MSSRTTEFPVDADFIQRWSPRSFTGKAMSRAELMSLFEAARWAPSTSNTQPWRFVYGLAGSAEDELDGLPLRVAGKAKPARKTPRRRP